MCTKIKLLIVASLLFVFQLFGGDDVMTGYQFTRVNWQSTNVLVSLSTNGFVPVYTVMPNTNNFVQKYYKRQLVAYIKVKVSTWKASASSTYGIRALSKTFISGALEIWKSDEYFDSVADSGTGGFALTPKSPKTLTDFTYDVHLSGTLFIGSTLYAGLAPFSTTFDDFATELQGNILYVSHDGYQQTEGESHPSCFVIMIFAKY